MRRNKWLAGGSVASLALALAAGVAAPATAAGYDADDADGRCPRPAAAVEDQMMASAAGGGGRNCYVVDLVRFNGPIETVPAGGVASSTALCPAGWEAISWGFDSSASVFVTPGAAAKVDGPPEGWVVFATNSTTTDGLIQAIVYCDAP